MKWAVNSAISRCAAAAAASRAFFFASSLFLRALSMAASLRRYEPVGRVGGAFDDAASAPLRKINFARPIRVELRERSF